MRKRQVGDKEAGGKRLEGDAEEPSDWELEKFPFRLKELRTFATFPTSQHSGFYFPPAAAGFETTSCLKCLQIIGVSYMAGGSALKLEIGYCVP